MHQYELMVILDPEVDERTIAPSLEKFLNVITNDGGTIENVDIWGRRRLAYEINKKAPLRHSTSQGKTVGQLIAALGELGKG